MITGDNGGEGGEARSFRAESVTNHRDQLYLTHIDEAAKNIEDAVGNQGRSALDDALVRDATMYRLQTLTESSQRLSEAFKDEHADIPWRQLAGFRNQLAHGYLEVDLDIVWSIIEHDLPLLVENVRTALALHDTQAVTEGPTP